MAVGGTLSLPWSIHTMLDLVVSFLLGILFFVVWFCLEFGYSFHVYNFASRCIVSRHLLDLSRLLSASIIVVRYFLFCILLVFYFLDKQCPIGSM